MSNIQLIMDNPLLLHDSAIFKSAHGSAGSYWYYNALFHTYARSAIEVMRNIERDCVTDKLTWQFAQYYNYPWKDDCILIRRYKEQFPESIIQFALNKAQTVANMLYTHFEKNIYPKLESNNFDDFTRYVLLGMSPSTVTAITNYVRSHKFLLQRSSSMSQKVDSDLLHKLNEVSNSAREIDFMVKTNYYSYSDKLRESNRTEQYLPLDVIKSLMTPNTFLDPANAKCDFSKVDHYLSNVRYTANVLSILYHLIAPSNVEYTPLIAHMHKPLQQTYDALMKDINDSYRVNVNKALRYCRQYADGTNAFVMGMPMNSAPINRDCGELEFTYPDSDIEKYVVLRHCVYQYNMYND